MAGGVGSGGRGGKSNGVEEENLPGGEAKVGH